jgi:type I restriction enzyme R subunit
MKPAESLRDNFAHLKAHDEQLVRLGLLAERYFAEDPNTSLLKLRQLAELLAQHVATRIGLFVSAEEAQYDLIRRLQEQGILTREIAQFFGEVRRAGNAASHTLAGDHRSALTALKITWQLGVWFHRSFQDPGFRSGPFVPPAAPASESGELHAELDRLNSELATYRQAHHAAAQQLAAVDSQLREARDDQAFWEQLALEAEHARAALAARLATLQAQSATQGKESVAGFVTAAHTAAAKLVLDETETRKLIDEQLRQAGWTVDSTSLRYARGARPEKGRNLAIAEWPTTSGPADYLLFVGLTPMAAVEAKRRNLDVSSALQQAKRYSRDFTAGDATLTSTTDAANSESAYRLPFAFASNGRPYLCQLATRSGVWFCDLRRPDSLGRALDGWYTPAGLSALLKRDERRADTQLQSEPFAYGFPLRHYQQAAIQAAESAIARGQREMLLAMATGTGKTRTCIALIYRLLKTQRCRRVLFLVDRSALGGQAANAFKDKRMESLQTFAEVFGIKELDEQSPDSDTAVHIATVQGRRVEALFAYADRLEARYAAARARVERLTPALLAKAFRGELVPQDPDDEPAGELLERIRAARTATPPKPRSRQGAGRPTKTQRAELTRTLTLPQARLTKTSAT